MLTFIEERRQRIRKAEAKAHAKGEARGEANVLDALSQDPRIAALLRDDPDIRRALRERGIELPANLGDHA